MRRAASLGAILVLVLTSCGQRQGSGSTEPSATELDPRRVAIAAAVFGALYEPSPEFSFERVILSAHICQVTWKLPGQPEEVVTGWGEGEVCQEPFTPAEQTALLEALPGLDASFTLDPNQVAERILKGDLHGVAILLSIGAIEDTGARIEVPAKTYCGGMCAAWITYEVQRGMGGWRVTGKVIEAVS